MRADFACAPFTHLPLQLFSFVSFGSMHILTVETISQSCFDPSRFLGHWAGVMCCGVSVSLRLDVVSVFVALG